MKKKLGPLPLWSWILIAGGTIGIIWYWRSHASPATPAASGLQLPDTGALPDTGGGGSGGASAPTTGATPDDVLSALQGLSSQISELPGQGAAVEPTPIGTFTGEITDVTDAISALQASGLLPAPQRSSTNGTTTHIARSGPHKGETYTRKVENGKIEHIYANGKRETIGAKKSSGHGSGGAGKTSKKPVRHTVEHKATTKAPKEKSHAPAKVTRKRGASQKHRTARPHPVRGGGRVG